MFAMGVVELMVFPLLALVLLYVVIRLAVKHGTLDAHREREADEERGRLASAVMQSRDSGL